MKANVGKDGDHEIHRCAEVDITEVSLVTTSPHSGTGDRWDMMGYGDLINLTGQERQDHNESSTYRVKFRES